jgi:rRNA maturation endonuclease Nob1
MRTTQGKCTACRRVYVWQGQPLLREACCPRCGTGLKRTTVYNGWRRQGLTPGRRTALP